MLSRLRGAPVNHGDPNIPFSDSTQYSGIWFSIHTIALKATTPAQIECAIFMIKAIIDSLKCANCRAHGQEYWRTHDVYSYLRHEKGLFYYTVDFHNKVNKDLGKPVLKREEALNIYQESTICTEGCGTPYGPQITAAYPSRVEITPIPRNEVRTPPITEAPRSTIRRMVSPIRGRPASDYRLTITPI